MLFTLYPFCDIVKLQIEKNRKIFNKKSEKHTASFQHFKHYLGHSCFSMIKY